jgi:hypothetical protein
MLKNRRALKCIRALEKIRKQKLKIGTTKGLSEYDPNEFSIRIGKQRGFGKIWKDRLILHEVGHAVIDTVWSKFDRSEFKRIFKGSSKKPYQANVLLNFLHDRSSYFRPSLTVYGKCHPEESWAEAFSFALANIEDSSESHKVIEQLAYADYVIRNLIGGKKRWGQFLMPTSTARCPTCLKCSNFYSRGSNSSTENWEIRCQHCSENLMLLS